MTDKGIFFHLRNIVTVLSLINLLSVFGEKAVTNHTAFDHVLADSVVRTRLWVSAGLFATLGLLSLGFLVVKSRDLLLDFDDGANRTKVVALVFGSVELLVALAIGAALLAAR
jgi:hypothetical protein